MGTEAVRHDKPGLTAFPQCFLEEFQSCPLVSCLGDDAFKHFVLVMEGPPEVATLTVDLPEHFVELPAPSAGSHTFDPSFSDLRGDHWTKAVPPISDRFVAHIDTLLMKEIFGIPERERKTDVEHRRPADDFRAGFEGLERAGMAMPGRSPAAGPS